MLTRVLAVAAVWMAFVGWCLAFGGAPARVPSVPQLSGPAFAAPARLDTSIEQQMIAFEHHAKVNMILYSGRLGEGAIASVPVIAVTAAPVSR